MAEYEVLLKFSGDKEAAKAIKALTEALKGTDTSVKNIEKSSKKSFAGLKDAAGSVGKAFKSLGNRVFSLQGLLAAAAGAFAVTKLIDAANKQEDAVTRLNTALAVTGSFSEEASKDLQDFASSIQDTTKFGDELVLNQLALAKSFGASNEQAKSIVSAATDLAASLNIDLNSATRNVAKTLGGFAGELGEVIPELKSLTKEQLLTGKGIDILAKQFQGAARGQIQTFSGALTQSKNAFGGLLEELGFLLTKNPAVIAAINAAQKLFKELAESVSDNRETLTEFITDGIEVFVEAVKIANAVINTIIDTFGVFRLAANFVTIAISELLAVGLEAFASLRDVVGTFVDVFDSDPFDLFRLSIFQIGQQFGETFSGIIQGARDLFGIFGEGSITEALDEAQASLVSFTAKIENTKNEVIESNNISATSFSNTAETIRGMATAVRGTSEATQESAGKIFDSINGVNPSVDKLADNFRSNLAGGIKQVEQQQKTSADAFKKSSDENLKTTQKANKALLKEEEKKNKELLKLESDLAKRRGKILELVAKQAEQAAKDPIEALLSGTEQLKQSLSDDELRAFKVELDQASVSNLVGAGAGLVQNITKGAEGAKNLIVGGASAFVSTIIPGLGKAVAPILDAFAQGPEAARTMVKEFLEGIPLIISNMILAVPAFIEELINQGPILLQNLLTAIPTLIDSLIQSIPRIISSAIMEGPRIINAIVASLPGIINSLISLTPNLISALVSQVPQIIQGLIREVPKTLPKLFGNLGGEVIKGILSSITKLPNLFLKLFGFDGAGRGAVEKFLGFDFPFIKFAKGGVVPGQARIPGDSLRNDTVPALLSPGEVVVPRSIVNLGSEAIAAFIDVVGLRRFKAQAVTNKDAEPVIGQLKSFGIEVPGFGFFKDFFNFAVDLVTDPKKSFEGIKGAISDTFDTIVSVTEALARGDITDVLAAIKSGAINIVTNLGKAILPPPLDAIFDILTSLGAELKIDELLKNPIKAVTNAVKSIKDKFVEQFKRIFNLDRIDRTDSPSKNFPLGVEAQRAKQGIGFQQGGLIPQGFPNDSFRAGLTSGEFVVNNSLTPKLEKFLEREDNLSTIDTENTNLLLRILDTVQRPIEVRSTLQFNQDTFANIILNLNRTNRRLA